MRTDYLVVRVKIVVTITDILTIVVNDNEIIVKGNSITDIELTKVDVGEPLVKVDFRTKV